MSGRQLRALWFAACASLPLAVLACQPAPKADEPPQLEQLPRLSMPVDVNTMPDPRRAWRELEPAAAEAATATHRLVGLGCGAARLTYTAEEEDHFPAPCYAIDTPDDMCPPAEGPPEPVLAWECARYLGDGW